MNFRFGLSINWLPSLDYFGMKCSIGKLTPVNAVIYPSKKAQATVVRLLPISHLAFILLATVSAAFHVTFQNCFGQSVMSSDMTEQLYLRREKRFLGDPLDLCLGCMRIRSFLVGDPQESWETLCFEHLDPPLLFGELSFRLTPISMKALVIPGTWNLNVQNSGHILIKVNPYLANVSQCKHILPVAVVKLKVTRQRIVCCFWRPSGSW